MYIVHVHVRVKQERIEDFKKASVENAAASIREPGIARFDVLQSIENPSHFELIEIYRTEQDPALHKETSHYAKWKETVEPMMAEPRQSRKFDNVFPEDAGF